jgi:hypothetical protein
MRIKERIMFGETKQATSATTSLIYITSGSLISVWMIIYYLYLRSHGGSDTAYLYVSGFFFSGVVLLLIGLAVGRIGHAARPAETAPTVAPQVTMQNAVPTTPGPAYVAQNPAPQVMVPQAPVMQQQPQPLQQPLQQILPVGAGQPLSVAPVPNTVVAASANQLVPNA